MDNAGGAKKTTNTYADGQWYHLVARKAVNRSIQNVNYYINGAAAGVDSGTGSQFDISESTNLALGLIVPVPDASISLVLLTISGFIQKT